MAEIRSSELLLKTLTNNKWPPEVDPGGHKYLLGFIAFLFQCLSVSEEIKDLFFAQFGIDHH
jgi:hypothetical protein